MPDAGRSILRKPPDWPLKIGMQLFGNVNELAIFIASPLYLDWRVRECDEALKGRCSSCTEQ